MMVMKLSWLMLEGLFVWCFGYYGSSVALALAALMVLIPVCSVFVNLYLKKKLRIHIEAPMIQRKGDPGRILVTIQNPTVFSALRIRLDLEVCSEK